ncbi:MBL fold metallo-hydrolase [Lysinibacillus sp. KU-BSD001]|uniref:MBL fold metallo-hydrolase n=1 Tax=Lysinibacillus sp. KU-BSD001 TaxID=3141328 RepID=UPI0036E66559
MKKLLIILMMLFLVGCTEAVQPTETVTVPTGKEMRVHFINVGQGDSIFIQSPNGKTMLIDGGVKGEGNNIVAYLRAQGVKQLDYVVATHPDADHIGGLISVLNSISVKNFIDSGKVHTSQTYEQMITLVGDKGIPYTVPKTGETVNLDEELDIIVVSADEHAADNNEASIVLKVTYGEVSFLLTGDAGVEMEKEMMATQNVQATILKAGHHGSNTSSSLAFIQAVQPEATILSYGQDNKYGHPHIEVIESLQTVHSQIYSTAEGGHIVVTTDGKVYSANTPEWMGVGSTSAVPVQSTGKVEIISKDVEAELVKIKNNGSEAVNLNGWQLLSVEGNQLFTFPNITLPPSKTITVSSGPDAKESSTVLKWTNKQIWLNSGDAAKLMNAKGDVVSEFE